MYEIEKKDDGEWYVTIPAAVVDIDNGDREAGKMLIKLFGVDDNWPTCLDMVRGRIGKDEKCSTQRHERSIAFILCDFLRKISTGVTQLWAKQQKKKKR